MKTKKQNLIKLISLGICILILSTVLFFFLYNEQAVFKGELYKSNVKDFVSCVSPWVASSISFSGLILGFFYYVEKQKIDFDDSNEKKQAVRYEFLLREIDYCDDIIEKFYHKQVSNSEIKLLCDNLTKHSILVVQFFEDNYIPLRSGGIQNPLSQWYSFVNTSDIVRIKEISEVDSVRQDEHSEYEFKYRNVKVYLLNERD